MADNDYGPGFQKAREAALARSGGVCQACGHFRATAAHHWQKRYSPDSEIMPEHLTGLCDLCHEMITTLRKALSSAETENHSEVREVVDRLTEKQKSYIGGLLRQGGYHFPDQGFVRITETLFKRFISGESEQLEQHHTILLGAWRAEGKRRVSDLNKREAAALIETLKKGDWSRPAPNPTPAPEQVSAPKPAAPPKPVSTKAPSRRGVSSPRKGRRWAIIVVLIFVAGFLLAFSGEKNTMNIIGNIKKTIHKSLH